MNFVLWLPPFFPVTLFGVYKICSSPIIFSEVVLYRVRQEGGS